MQGPVYAVLDKAEPEIHVRLRAGQPNFFAPFNRSGIDPFTQRFPVTLRLEGTMRGTGGLHLADQHCETDVAGLYACGDVATRELICGGFTGGASHNAAWAISSGSIAGAGAGVYDRPNARAACRPYSRPVPPVQPGAERELPGALTGSRSPARCRTRSCPGKNFFRPPAPPRRAS